MADFMSPEARSRVMSSIRSRNTSPELYVRKMVWAEGFRYRLHVKRLPGTPDLALAQYRLAVFVHGCFWHQHDCLKGRRPSSNREYWDNKLDRNISRDAKNHSLLQDLGWRVVTVWECKLTEDTYRALKLLRSLRAYR